MTVKFDRPCRQVSCIIFRSWQPFRRWASHFYTLFEFQLTMFLFRISCTFLNCFLQYHFRKKCKLGLSKYKHVYPTSFELCKPVQKLNLPLKQFSKSQNLFEIILKKTRRFTFYDSIVKTYYTMKVDFMYYKYKPEHIGKHCAIFKFFLKCKICSIIYYHTLKIIVFESWQTFQSM